MCGVDGCAVSVGSPDLESRVPEVWECILVSRSHVIEYLGVLGQDVRKTYLSIQIYHLAINQLSVYLPIIYHYHNLSIIYPILLSSICLFIYYLSLITYHLSINPLICHLSIYQRKEKV